MKQLRNFNSEQTKVEINKNPDLAEAYKKYSGMDEDALINQLIMTVRQQRANGTYDPQSMQGYLNMLSPHLSQEQGEKLKNLIEIINNENV